MQSIIACLRIFRHAGTVLHWAINFLSIPLRHIGRALIPGILFSYFAIRKLKTWMLNYCRAAGGRKSCFIISHRYFAHTFVAAVVLFASISSLRAADEVIVGTIGKKILLNEVVGAQELSKNSGGVVGGIVEDDIIPSTEGLASYLEARFQNEQLPAEPAAETIPIPLSFEGTAAARIELPGVAIPLTRAAIVEYTVQPEDTPWSIAERFGISVATVLWENELSLWSIIRPGQILKILPVSGVSHTVKKGDTLAAIAKRYSASAGEISTVNNLDDHTALAVGINLMIPGGRPYVAPQPKPVVRREVVAAPAQISIPSSGQLLWPIPNSKRVTQYFRWRHTGLDIGDKYGSTIVAADNGTIELSGWGAGGWGYTIVVDHGNGMKTRYAHASKLLVEAGQNVEKGQTIALVGSTGRSTGPHLHFGVYVNGRAVNPLEYLR